MLPQFTILVLSILCLRFPDNIETLQTLSYCAIISHLIKLWVYILFESSHWRGTGAVGLAITAITVLTLAGYPPVQLGR